MDEIKKEEKVYKKRRKRKKWEKTKNFFINSLPKTERALHNTHRFFPLKSVSLNLPVDFSTFSDLDGVMVFISKCKSENIIESQLVTFNFSKVTNVNAGALSLLLSVIQDLTDLKIRIKGNLPKDLKSRKEFIESGFLEYFLDGNGRRAASKNKILVKGVDKINQVRTAQEISKAMKTVFGKESHNQALQGALIEMMANTVNHAFPTINNSQQLYFEQFLNNKRWYFSAFHDAEEKKVYFSFIDNGIGILNTIRRGTFKKLVEKLTDSEILRNAFEGRYRSSTKYTERGMGLPTIKAAFQMNAIKSLKIVTGDYLYIFDNQTGVKLSKSFEGTCYFWVLDDSCDYGKTS